MEADQVTLEDLCAEIRKSASSDVEFAQRVALVCCKLVEGKEHPFEAIPKVFRIHSASEFQRASKLPTL